MYQGYAKTTTRNLEKIYKYRFWIWKAGKFFFFFFFFCELYWSFFLIYVLVCLAFFGKS